MDNLLFTVNDVIKGRSCHVSLKFQPYHIPPGVALTHLDDPSNAKQAYEQAISIEVDSPMT